MNLIPFYLTRYDIDNADLTQWIFTKIDDLPTQCVLHAHR